MLRRSFLGRMSAAASALAVTPRSFAAEAPPQIKFAQLGVGHAHAGGKFAAVRALPETYEILGLAEDDSAVRAKFEKSTTYANMPWFTERELLKLPGLQVVAVEKQMVDACAAAQRAIASGKHIHLDKPGALKHGEFRAMRFDAERRGLTVQMGYMLRYNPAFTLLFQAVREGWLGDVLEVDAAMGKLGDQAKRDELASLPGGGMFELACHIVDATVTLLGKPQRVDAFSTPTRTEPGQPQDNQLAVLTYPKATATLRCNHADPFGGPRRHFYVVGTKGSLDIQPLESGKCRLMLSESHGSYKKGEQALALEMPADRYIEEFRDLARVVRGEKKLAWDAKHDVAVHETVLRASGAWKDE